MHLYPFYVIVPNSTIRMYRLTLSQLSYSCHHIHPFQSSLVFCPFDIFSPVLQYRKCIVFSSVHSVHDSEFSSNRPIILCIRSYHALFSFLPFCATYSVLTTLLNNSHIYMFCYYFYLYPRIAVCISSSSKYWPVPTTPKPASMFNGIFNVVFRLNRADIWERLICPPRLRYCLLR